jgi:hypothetical protein
MREGSLAVNINPNTPFSQLFRPPEATVTHEPNGQIVVDAGAATTSRTAARGLT